MRKTWTAPEAGAAAFLQERWPEVLFTSAETRSGDSTYLSWENGPTKDEVSEVLREFPNARWYFLRHHSYTAWAILRGPRMPEASEELPWRSDALRAWGRTHPRDPEVAETRHQLEKTNLEDLHVLTSDPHLLARAEIAGAFGNELGRYRYEEFDHWLRHGGWAMTGDVTHAPQRTA